MRLRNLIVLCLPLAMLVGCAGQVSPEFLKARDDAVVFHNATTQTSAEYQAELDKLPVNSPARKPIEETKKVADQAAVKSQQAIDIANVAIQAAQTGDYATGAVKIAGSIPALVPYTGLIGVSIVAGMSIFNGIKRRNNEQAALKALKQVVVSVDKAFPDKSEADKQILNNIQDTDTKALVTAAKNGSL